MSTKFDGSEKTELREGAAYDHDATSPLGGAAIADALVNMLGVPCKHQTNKPFSTAIEGSDMTRLRQWIKKTCPVIDGVLKDPLFGKDVTFGTCTPNPRSLHGSRKP